MFGLHPIDLIAVLVVALLIFGPKKLPEMGSAIGKSIKEFRKGMNELNSPEAKSTSLSAPVPVATSAPVVDAESVIVRAPVVEPEVATEQPVE
jgi:sec-independent protein translocase protein TatA